MTPRVEETVARLASWMPDARARESLEDLVGVQVSKATARRATLDSGEAGLAVCEGEVERLKRGVEQATEVCAVQDGAQWLQGLVDYQRADAVRILDFAHAAEDINEIGPAGPAAGGRLPGKWLVGVLHRLKHQGPGRVLKHLTWLAARYPSSLIQEKLAYLQKREAHMQYPSYQQAGWPSGSGSVASANKVVVEARLKGAGMRWGRQNVNPMLVLRNAVCNRRWHETWAKAVAHRRARRTTRRLGAGYSWRQPFLRLPPSTAAVSGEAGAK